MVGLWAQPNAAADDGPRIAAALRALAAWLDAEEIRQEADLPDPWAEALRT